MSHLHHYTEAEDIALDENIDIVYGEEQEELLKEEREAEILLKHRDDVLDGDNLVIEEEEAKQDGENDEETDRQQSPVLPETPKSTILPEVKQPLKERLIKLNELLEKAQTYTKFLIEDGLMTETEVMQKSFQLYQEEKENEMQKQQQQQQQASNRTNTRKSKSKTKNSKRKCNGKRNNRDENEENGGLVQEEQNLAAPVLKKPKILKFGQPEMMNAGGVMRYYQLVGLNWLISLYENGVSGILADEMGLGKTIQTISLLCHLFEQGIPGPFIIVAPLSTLSNWKNEFTKWAPKLKVFVYHGSKKERLGLRMAELPKLVQKPTPLCNVLVTSYEMSIRDARYLRRIPFKYLVVDEAHRLKNFECRLIKELKSYITENRLLLTGTPLQNNLTELWSLLNFLIPELFDDLENFRRWFDFDSSDSTVAEEKPVLINKLHTILRPFILRRMKNEVELDLPSKKEYLLYSSMKDIQKEYYQAIKAKDLTAVLEKQGAVHDNSSSTRLLNIIMQLRKTCNHPYLIAEFQSKENESIEEQNKRFLSEVVEHCGKFSLLDRMLKKLKARGHKVLIFSLMTRMLDIIEDYLELTGEKYCRLDGSVAHSVRTERIKKFNEDPEVFCFLLSTRAGGLGINLTAADTVIIYDSDWNPQVDLQAQDRCHRIGQTKPVRVFRLLTADSVERKIWQTAQRKLQLEKLIIHKGNFKGASSKGSKITFTATNLLEILSGDPEEKDEHRFGISDSDLDMLLDHEREDLTNGPGYEVVNYQYDNFMA